MDAVNLDDTIIKVPEQYIVSDSLVYRWHITSWADAKKKDRMVSPIFSCGSTNWRLLLFPNGNKTAETISCFLECVTIKEPNEDGSIRDPKWHCCAYFGVSLNNTEHNAVRSAPSDAHYRFSGDNNDWGFSKLITHANFVNQTEGHLRPIMEKDNFVVTLSLKLIYDEFGILWNPLIDWDSKVETGFVGLKNQGATCYLNSLIQSLYYTNYFRKATYEIPTTTDDPVKSVPYALQRLFYHMQFSDGAVGTNELTRSFGWDTMDAFHQHDVQELNRVLQDNLEKKMKGTPVEGAIKKLFTGKMKSYITCLNVDFESSRIEEYYDIQLNVKGCKNLIESFRNYCMIETLEGDNKYFAEGFGLQSAKKGVIFESFPPVLHLQLKRFDYDMERDQFVKINDRHEFPLSLDLGEFLNVPPELEQKYRLQGVLVHSGDLNAGHYYALIRPKPNGKWFKYDDDKVLPATLYEVLDVNFGGVDKAEGAAPTRFFTNAYMLVYIRESDEVEVLADITDDDIPLHLRERVKEEIRDMEKRKQDEDERHFYMNLHLVTDKDLSTYGGFDIGFEGEMSGPKALDAPYDTVRILKTVPLSDVRLQIAEQFEVDLKNVALWSVSSRLNKTARLGNLFTEDSYAKTVYELSSNQTSRYPEDLRIYAQILMEESKPDCINLFLKYYDVDDGTMRVVGNIQQSKSINISSILPHLRALALLVPLAGILIYEEVKPGMIDLLKTDISFESAELSDGDILCYQKDKKGRNVADYFDFIQNRILVKFQMKGSLDNFEIVMSRKMSYGEVVDQLAGQIKHDAAKIRLYNSRGNGSIGPPAMPRLTLGKILDHSQLSINQNINLIYYELLEVSLEELDRKRYIKVSYLDKGKEDGPHSILVEKNGTFELLFSILTAKLSLPPNNYRFMEVLNSRKSRHFELSQPLSLTNDYAQLFFEVISEDEIDMPPNARMIEVFHFQKEIYRPHSLPFQLLYMPGESVQSLKSRLKDVIGKDFDRMKVVLVAQDGTLLALNDEEGVVGAFDGAIGLDHIDKARRSGGVGVKIA